MPTKIEWATDTWNPITGCTKISEACQNCYAERMSKRLAGRCGYPEGEPFRVTLHPDKLDQPMKWKKPRMIFVCSMGDLFHEDVPFEFIASVFGVMANSSQNTYMVLTKRPQRMKEFFDWLSLSAAIYYARDHRTVPYDDDRINVFIMKIASEYGINLDFMRKWPLFNVWLGVTAENQEQADKRIPILLQIPAAVRFVSVEPMLGPVDIDGYLGFNGPRRMGDGLTYYWVAPKLDWVICGGETGPGARPMHPDWVRSLRDQCQAARVPFFFKQWGEWGPVPTEGVPVRGCMDNGKFHFGPNPGVGLAMYRVGKKAAGRLLDGQEWNQYPEVRA